MFEASIQPAWKEVVQSFQIKQKLANRKALDYPTYEALHRMQMDKSIIAPKEEFALASISTEVLKEGARYYEWVSAEQFKQAEQPVLSKEVV